MYRRKFSKQYKDLISKWYNIKNTVDRKAETPADLEAISDQSEADEKGRIEYHTNCKKRGEACRDCPSCVLSVLGEYNLYSDAYKELFIEFKFLLTMLREVNIKKFHIRYKFRKPHDDVL